MTWREEIYDYAQNGDVEGVLRMYDLLCDDRDRVRQLNSAYINQIAELKGGKPKNIVGLDECLKLQQELNVMLKR